MFYSHCYVVAALFFIVFFRIFQFYISNVVWCFILNISLPFPDGSTRSLADTAAHYFIILVRNGNHLVFTQMVSTHDAMVRGSLDFPNMIKMSDIRQNFKVNLEIYSMVSETVDSKCSG